MKRKIAIFTGGRFEYGILRPVISEIHKSDRLELQLIVSGTHLLNKYGSTLNIIKKDKFPISASVKIVQSERTAGKVGKEIGKGIIEFTKILLNLKPDAVLLNGDRSEAFAAAIAAAFIPIAIAHIHGGDLTKAGFDETIRHAITKLAHIHFAATKKSRERIIKMGENPKNVFLVGAPGLDNLLNEPNLDKNILENKIKGKLEGKIIVVLQHPVSTTPITSGKEISETTEALKKVEGTKILIYPNGDLGSEAIIDEIEKFRGKKGYIVVKNLDRSIYANILRIADVFMGNSSAGIIETASFGLPTINIGSRQFGRERNKNIFDVSYESNKIEKILKYILSKKIKPGTHNIYGIGDAGRKIVSVLESIKIDSNLIQKHFYES